MLQTWETINPDRTRKNYSFPFAHISFRSISAHRTGFLTYKVRLCFEPAFLKKWRLCDHAICKRLPCSPGYHLQRQLQPSLTRGRNLRKTQWLKAFIQVFGQGKDIWISQGKAVLQKYKLPYTSYLLSHAAMAKSPVKTFVFCKGGHTSQRTQISGSAYKIIWALLFFELLIFLYKDNKI